MYSICMISALNEVRFFVQKLQKYSKFNLCWILKSYKLKCSKESVNILLFFLSIESLMQSAWASNRSACSKNQEWFCTKPRGRLFWGKARSWMSKRHLASEFNPAMFNGIQIRWRSWPWGEHSNLLIVQPVLHAFCGMTWSSIMHQEVTLMKIEPQGASSCKMPR